MILIIVTLLAYLIGSLSGSLLIGRVRGIDIRHQGSGNAGGTNALRTQGWRFALGVVAIDVGKGVLATWLGLQIPSSEAPASDAEYAHAALCGFAAVIGHCWPLFFGFRGGKGAATAAGALLVMAPCLVVPLLGVWTLTLIASGYAGLATLVAAGALPMLATLPVLRGAQEASVLIAFSLAVAAVIVFTHRGNLARLVGGHEPRFERARLLHRLLQRTRS